MPEHAVADASAAHALALPAARQDFPLEIEVLDPGTAGDLQASAVD